MYKILKEEINSPTKFKRKFSEYIQMKKIEIKEKYNIEFNEEGFTNLLLSVCRSNDFGVISRQGNKMFFNEDKVSDWIEKKLLPKYCYRKIGR